MSLIKSPVRSAALLARCRSNAQHSTGPRTPEGKAKSRLNGLRHGRRARALAHLLPRGLNFQDRGLYLWILRAIRSSFPPQKPSHEGKVLRTALQVWCQMRVELEGKSDDRTMHLAEKRSFRVNTGYSRFAFRLQRTAPRGMLTFRTRFCGRIPRRPVGGSASSEVEVARASLREAQGELSPPDAEVARASSPPDVMPSAGWKPALPAPEVSRPSLREAQGELCPPMEIARASSPPDVMPSAGWKSALPEPPRPRRVLAVWKGESRVQDWGREPAPDEPRDPVGFYRCRRDLRRYFERQARALRREELREARQQEALRHMENWLGPMRAAWRRVGRAFAADASPASLLRLPAGASPGSSLLPASMLRRVGRRAFVFYSLSRLRRLAAEEGNPAEPSRPLRGELVEGSWSGSRDAFAV